MATYYSKVAEASAKLGEDLKSLVADDAKLQAVLDYIKKMEDSANAENAPIIEFPQNLDWLNTPAPLSIKDHLKGKIVVIDFWTFCCINCIHLLPVMAELEEKYHTHPEIAFIGCHSAKFETEKDTENIRQAILRYQIGHIVLNDCDAKAWKDYDISCWPTVVVLSPSGRALVRYVGEGHHEVTHESLVAQHCFRLLRRVEYQFSCQSR